MTQQLKLHLLKLIVKKSRWTQQRTKSQVTGEPSGQKELEMNNEAPVENAKEDEEQAEKSGKKSEHAAETVASIDPMKDKTKKKIALDVTEAAGQGTKADTGVTHDGKDTDEMQEAGDNMKTNDVKKTEETADVEVKDQEENNDGKDTERCIIKNASGNNNEKAGDLDAKIQNTN